MNGWVESASGLLLPASVEQPPRLTAVDLFCGCGGFSLGIIEGGFHVLAGVEKDPQAAVTYLTNLGAYPIDIRFVEDEDRNALEKLLKRNMKAFRKEHGFDGLSFRSGSARLEGSLEREQCDEMGDEIGDGPSAWSTGFKGVPVFFLGDICKITGADILGAIGLQRGELDLVVGGPPCQGFSVAGKRHIADPRNTLIFEFARLVCEMRPKTLCMENVPGMLSMVTEAGVPVIDEVCSILERGSFGEFSALRSMLAEDPTRRIAKRKPKTRRGAKRVEADEQQTLFGEERAQ